jgi:hypothetical protein
MSPGPSGRCRPSRGRSTSLRRARDPPISVGKVVPDLRDDGTTWPFVVLGAGYGLLGVLIAAYGLHRGREVDRAIRAGRWLTLDDRAMWLIGGLTIALGILAVGAIVVDA